MKILGLVAARKNSVRFPGKNLALFEGVPLYARAVKQGGRLFRERAFSTDYALKDLERSPVKLEPIPPGKFDFIARPPGLALDDTPMYAVVLHVALQLALNRDDWICLLQPTCPLRTDGEIMRVVARSISTGSGYYSTNVPVAKKEMPPNGSIYCLKVSQWGAMERTKHESHEVGIGMYLGREEIDVNTPDDLARAEAIAKG